MKKIFIPLMTVAVVVALLIGGCMPAPPEVAPPVTPPVEPVPPAPPAEYPLGKAVIRAGGQDICSGMNADYGRQMIMGATLAIEEINAAGGILGSMMELNFRDTEFNPELSLRNATWQVEDWGADFLFGFSNEECFYTVCEHLVEWDKLMFGCHVGDCFINEKYVYEQGHRNVFKTSTPYYQDAILPALYLVKDNPEITSWANMNADYGYGYGVGDCFKECLEANNIDIPCVAEPGAPYGTADFSSHIAAIMAAKPSFVLSTPWAGEAVSVLRQAVVAGLFEQDWFKVWFQCMGGSIDVAEGITDDVRAGKFHGKLWGTGRYVWNQSDRPENVRFVEAFRDRYAGRYPNYSAATCYTSMYIFKRAVEETGSLHAEDLIPVIEGMEVWDMPLGNVGEDNRPPFQFRPEDHAGCYTTPCGRYTFTPEVGVAFLTDLSDIPWFEYYRNPPDYVSP